MPFRGYILVVDKMKIIKKLSKYVETKGWICLLKVLAEKILQFTFYYRREYLYSFELMESNQNITSNISIEVILSTEEDLEPLEKGEYKNANLFKTWINNGSFFFSALNRDKIIGYVCMSPSPVDHWSTRIGFKKKVIWEHDTFVLSDYRGKNIFPEMISIITPILIEKGYIRVLCTINKKNQSAIRAHEKIGYKRIGEVRQVHILGLEKFWISACG